MSDVGRSGGSMFSRMGWMGQDVNKPQTSDLRSRANDGNNNQNDNNQNGNGGGNQQQNNNNQNGNNGGGNGNNNDGNNDKLLDDIWNEAQQQAKKDAPQNQQQNNNNNNQQQQAPDAKAEVAAYLQKVGLTKTEFTDADITKFQEDPRGYLSALEDRIIKSHVEGMRGADTLMTNKIQKAVEEAVNKSKGFYEQREIQDLLTTKYPYMSKPEVGPVAQTVMQRLLDKGMTRDQALEGTDKFFKRIGTYANEPNANRNDGYRRTPQASSDDNWVDALRGN